MGRVIKGKDGVIRLCLVAMLANGHVLFEDLPGTGKTMLYYITDLVQATRTDALLSMGASSRASQSLLRAARVLTASPGRDRVTSDDVVALVEPVLNHRLMLTPEAQLRDETVANVVDRIRNRVKVGASGTV